MTKAKVSKLVRKAHRYLGLFFGIQFLFWTISGLYFSWTNIKTIRGEDIRNEEPALIITSNAIPPDSAINEVRKYHSIRQLKMVQLVNVLGQSYYQVSFHNGKRIQTVLVSANTGKLKESLQEAEAIAVAKSRLKHPEEPVTVQYITETNAHHEYREKPLPAYAITFKGKIQSTVYVSAEIGTVQSFRNTQWRIFDFLWMLHIMDYQERDNINNWVLRIFSIFGIITLLSGFVLYFISFKPKIRKIRL